MEIKLENPERTLTCTMTGTVKEFKLLRSIMTLIETVPAALNRESSEYVKNFMNQIREQLREVVSSSND